MKRSMPFVMLFVLALIAAQCAPAPTQTPSQKESAPTTEEVKTKEARTVVIGFTASQTGSQNVPSIRQNNGLKLWMDQVNKAGGVQLSDGTVVKFAAVSYDDESSTDRVQELYTRLATEDKADFLISPYSSGLAEAAAIIAEQYGKVMITTGAASDSTYKKGFTSVFQAYTPASRYLTGAVDLLAQVDPKVKKIAFVHENDQFSTDVVNAAKEYAGSKGYEVVLFEGYDSGTTDFGPFINKIGATQPNALMGGGHFQDGSTFARQLFDKKVPLNFVALLVAPPEPDFAALGDAAVGIIGPSQWEPLAAFTPESAKGSGVEWFGPLGSEFVKAYEAAYNGEEPSYHSAGGYAAGMILQKAIMAAASTDPKAVKDALDKMDILTFYGRVKFETSSAAHGLQVGHEMVYVQWQKDGGKLAKQVVWPREGATAQALYPMP